MTRPDIRKRIYNLSSQAYHPSSNPNEAANARAMLAELQADRNIGDVEVAFIAESEEKKPASSDDSERLPDVFELLVHLFDRSGIILTFPQVVIVALWILFTYVVFDFYRHAPRLLLRSHKPACGKTTLLSFIHLLVDNGFKSDNASAASLYTRLQECSRTTFSLDEMENSTLGSRDPFLRAFFDSGHRYDGCFSRKARLKGGRTVSVLPWRICSTSLCACCEHKEQKDTCA